MSASNDGGTHKGQSLAKISEVALIGEALTSSETLVSLPVPLVVNAIVSSHLSLVTVRFLVGLALAALQARIILCPNTNHVSYFDVGDFGTDTNGSSDDFLLLAKIKY